MASNAIQKIAKICNQITKKDEKPQKPYTVGIILAAGKGSRMQNPEKTAN